MTAFAGKTSSSKKRKSQDIACLATAFGKPRNVARRIVQWRTCLIMRVAVTLGHLGDSYTCGI